MSSTPLQAKKRRQIKARLILASSSPRRAALLREAGIPFEIRKSRVRELTQEEMSVRCPTELAHHNACLKAVSVSRKCPGRWVLGADTLVVLGKLILGKPRHLNEARRMLKKLSGRSHRVVTAVVLCWGGKVRYRFEEVSNVRFKPLSTLQIETYLSLIDPLDKAGAYAAQEYSELIIEEIRGSRSNVVGLPIEELQELLSVGSSLWEEVKSR